MKGRQKGEHPLQLLAQQTRETKIPKVVISRSISPQESEKKEELGRPAGRRKRGDE